MLGTGKLENAEQWAFKPGADKSCTERNVAYLCYLHGLVAVQIPHLSSFVTGGCKDFTSILLKWGKIHVTHWLYTLEVSQCSTFKQHQQTNCYITIIYHK